MDFTTGQDDELVQSSKVSGANQFGVAEIPAALSVRLFHLFPPMPKQSYGTTTQHRALILLLALLDFANDSLTTDRETELEGLRSQIQAHWQSDRQLVIRTKVRYLEALIQLTGEQLSIEQIKTALKHLETVVGMLTDNRTKQQGSDNWHFTLTWQYNRWERAANERAFVQAWATQRPDRQPSSAQPRTDAGAVSPEDTWQQLCRAALDTRLTTNPLTAQAGMSFDVGDIYMPLGVMERPPLSLHADLDDLDESPAPVYLPADLLRHWQAQPEIKRIAIVGEPGVGKTTLLQKIALHLLDNQLPIWISLADLAGQSIGDYLTHTWLPEALQTFTAPVAKQEALVQVCQQGQVWLLLDAVDEMGINASLALTQLAKQLRGWLASVHIVLTCRLNLWDGEKNALADFTTYRSLGFNHPQSQHQVGTFIQRWFCQTPQLGVALDQALARPGLRPIREVVQNPLYLALLCRTWTLTQGQLPGTKATLYRQFVTAFYEWKQDLFPTTLRQRHQLQQVLAQIAWQAMQQATPFRLSQQLVYQACSAIDPDLMTLALQLGWLKPVGISAIGDKVYAFSHPTFQEYFAAQAVTDGLVFVGKFPIFKWQEVILLWLGREDVPAAAKENLLRAFETFDDRVGGFYHYRTYFLAAAGLAEFPQYIRGASLVAQLVQWRFGQTEPALPPLLVERAGIALSRSARSLTIPALEHFLQTVTDPLSGWLAAHSLGKNHDPGNPIAIATLATLLGQVPNGYLKIDIAKSLGIVDRGNQLAIDTLIELIGSSSHPALQRRAAQRLGKIDPGNHFARQTLERLAREATDPHLRSMTLDTLAQLEGLTTARHPVNQRTGKKQERRRQHQNSYQIDPARLIDIFVLKINTTTDPLARIRLAYRIAQLDGSHPLGVSQLVARLVASVAKTEIKQVAEFLRELISIEQLPQVLPPVRDLYLAPVNSVQYQECFKLLWYWSRLLSYQEFSKLWSKDSASQLLL